MLENEMIRLAELALEVLPFSIIGGLGASLLMRSASLQIVGLGDFWAFLAMWAVAVAADYYGGPPALGVIRVLYGVLLALGVVAWLIALAMKPRSNPRDEEDPTMMKETPSETALMKRIEGLERTLAYLQGKVQRGTPGPQPSRTVEAEQFIIRDSAGNRRAELGVSSEGRGVGLRLCNQTGQDRFEVTIGSDGSPILRVCDQAGKIRAGLGVTADGWTVLALFDQAEKGRAHLSVKPDGSPDLNFRDQTGTRRAEVGLALGGEPWVALFDQAGETRSVLGLKPDGSPDLNFRDQTGTVRADMFVARDGSPGLVLLGENEQALFNAP
jgi:hypothetical protein